MTDYRPGGRRRMDRVLDPAFVTGLDSLPAADLRSRRDDAVAEERDISYIRRLLQGRVDLLRAHLEHRRDGRSTRPGPRPDSELVEEVTAALREAPAASASTRLVDVEAPDHSQRRRAAEVAVDDVRLSDPTTMDDDALAALVARLEELEHQASATRRAVITVLDQLTAEVQRRVVEGEMSPDAGSA